MTNSIKYFDRFFPCYNTDHYHSGIDYVIPEQLHKGLRDRIVAERKARLANQRQLRKEVNRLKSYLEECSEIIYNNNINLITRSVMNP